MEITVIPKQETEKDQRIKNAMAKLAEFDKDIVIHLEQLADLAATNKYMFQVGLSFLKQRK